MSNISPDQMRYLFMQPRALNADDLEQISGILRTAEQRGGMALLRYWSADTRLLWLGLQRDGRLASWLVMPSPTFEVAQSQSLSWQYVLADGLRAQGEQLTDGESKDLH